MLIFFFCFCVFFYWVFTPIRPSVSVRVRDGVSNLRLSFQAGTSVSFGHISSWESEYIVLVNIVTFLYVRRAWQCQKTYLLTCAPNEDTNKPAHPRSLIRVFVIRMDKRCILCYLNCAKWRFWSDCANAQADLNLRWAHTSEGILF